MNPIGLRARVRARLQAINIFSLTTPKGRGRSGPKGVRAVVGLSDVPKTRERAAR